MEFIDCVYKNCCDFGFDVIFFFDVIVIKFVVDCNNVFFIGFFGGR